MLYTERDEQGNITAITTDSTKQNQSQPTNEELVEFLSSNGNLTSHEQVLSHMDSKFVRVLDDLIDLLVKKNIIMFTELPEKAQQKIFERKDVRHHLQEDSLLVEDDII